MEKLSEKKQALMRDIVAVIHNHQEGESGIKDYEVMHVLYQVLGGAIYNHRHELEHLQAELEYERYSKFRVCQ